MAVVALASGEHLGVRVLTLTDPDRRNAIGPQMRDELAAAVAAVAGPAIGAGLNLAMCCDVRIAGPEATFGATFTRLGLHPGGGCSAFLVRALGPQRALAMLLDGATLTAPEALAQGLVLEVVADPLAAAAARAARYAALDPDLARGVKRVVQLADRAGPAAALEFESWAQAATATAPQVRAAAAARKPAASGDD